MSMSNFAPKKKSVASSLFFFLFLPQKGRSKENPPRKPTSNFLFTQAYAFLPENLQFALFVDNSARASIKVWCHASL
jgi:hypothetical protein